MLAVVIHNLAEITVLAEKIGVPRHAFLDFMNNSVMGSAPRRQRAGSPSRSRRCAYFSVSSEPK